MSNIDEKELNKSAKIIADYFFAQTKRRATKPTFVQTLIQAKSLLLDTFTESEIKQGIDWCVKYPPPKGFYSIYWLAYDLENILKKIKLKEMERERKEKETTDLPELNIKPTKFKIKDKRVGNDFDFNLFKGE